MRRTPMPARTQPVRRAAVPRTPAAAGRRAPGTPRKAARAVPFPPAVAALLDARDGFCQRCGSPEGLHRHHRRLKGSGGSTAPHAQCACNGVELCGATCHPWVHAHPGQAEAEGWIVSRFAARPGDVGVMRFSATGSGATQWPDCSGNWLATAPEAGEAA